jgi:hypothetical protein
VKYTDVWQDLPDANMRIANLSVDEGCMPLDPEKPLRSLWALHFAPTGHKWHARSLGLAPLSLAWTPERSIAKLHCQASAERALEMIETNTLEGVTSWLENSKGQAPALKQDECMLSGSKRGEIIF